MMIAYDVATAAVAGMMTGNEFAVAAFVHPQLRRLDDTMHAHAAAPLARSLGKVMPFWYALALVLILGAAFEHRPISNRPGFLIASAGILWAAVIIVTIAILVPINKRIASLDPERPYIGWLRDRSRWDRLHRLRVALLLIAVVLLLTGLFESATMPI
jgi:uncharacterized membrane protein